MEGACGRQSDVPLKMPGTVSNSLRWQKGLCRCDEVEDVGSASW